MKQSNVPVCSSCGSTVPINAKFRCGCGTTLSLLEVEVSQETPKKKAPKDYSMAGCAVCLLAISIFGWAVMSGVNEASRRVQTDQATINAVIENSQQRMRKHFDVLEQTADVLKSESLRLRVRDLRLEWEEGKDDPQKVEVVRQKIELLSNDIDNHRY